MDYAWMRELKIDRESTRPVYMQLHEGIILLITQGLLLPGIKLPGSRMLSEHLQLHRKTVVAAFDLLVAEQWLQSLPRQGIFVHKDLPQIKSRALTTLIRSYPTKTSYDITPNTSLYRKQATAGIPGFDDGYPDARLSPIKELGRAYVQALDENRLKKKLSRYTPLEGESLFRSELAKMMNEHRSLAIKPENILITKGSQMSYYLTARVLLNKGDNVIVSSPNYLLANICYETMGANLVKVGVDDYGMNIDEVEMICKKKKIRCLDITSHHHHPTTVTLVPERRVRLLQLAQKYNFAIIEDDYDYDFHYGNKPLLPLASKDTAGNVIYIGSYSKIISHAFRVGYIIAPKNLIDEITYFRRIVDRHSDPLLEESIGRLMASGTLQRYIRKANGVYKARRDHAYELLKELSGYMTYNLPDGGLAFWSLFDKAISLPALSKKCAQKGLYISDGSFYNYDRPEMNGVRMGFASMNEQEMESAITLLKNELRRL